VRSVSRSGTCFLTSTCTQRRVYGCVWRAGVRGRVRWLCPIRTPHNKRIQSNAFGSIPRVILFAGLVVWDAVPCVGRLNRKPLDGCIWTVVFCSGRVTWIKHSTSCAQAGEYFVAAERNKRGAFAVTVAGNMPKIDIIASNCDSSRTVYIQVKTKRGGKNCFVLSLGYVNTYLNST